MNVRQRHRTTSVQIYYVFRKARKNTNKRSYLNKIPPTQHLSEITVLRAFQYFIEIKNIGAIAIRSSRPSAKKCDQGEHQPVMWVGYIRDRAAPHDGCVQKRDIFC